MWALLPVGGETRAYSAGAARASRSALTAGGAAGSPGRWSQHAADRPGASSTRGGSSERQRSKTYGQRVWKRQPGGGCDGSGTSPGSASGEDPGAVGARHGADQGLAVRVERRRPERPGRRGLDDLAEVHDRDGVGDVADDREVVRDEQQAELELAREPGQEVRDLRLRGGIERGQGLVEDDHRRDRRERPRDRDALTLTARELVRVAPGRARRQADLLEQLRDPRRPLRAWGEPEGRQRLADLLADPPARD